MLYDAYGRYITGINNLISKKQKEIEDEFISCLKQSLYQRNKLNEILLPPRIIKVDGNKTTREEVGLPPINFSGGKNIIVPLNYSIPITLESKDEMEETS